jgi:hypothetical protein
LLTRLIKELDTRAALLEFAYEFRTVAKRLERDERNNRHPYRSSPTVLKRASEFLEGRVRAKALRYDAFEPELEAKVEEGSDGALVRRG